MRHCTFHYYHYSTFVIRTDGRTTADTCAAAFAYQPPRMTCGVKKHLSLARTSSHLHTCNACRAAKRAATDNPQFFILRTCCLHATPGAGVPPGWPFSYYPHATHLAAELSPLQQLPAGAHLRALTF